MFMEQMKIQVHPSSYTYRIYLNSNGNIEMVAMVLVVMAVAMIETMSAKNISTAPCIFKLP